MAVSQVSEYPPSHGTTANVADHVSERTSAITKWIHRGHESLITGGGREGGR
jgi:hypothetical protein